MTSVENKIDKPKRGRRSKKDINEIKEIVTILEKVEKVEGEQVEGEKVEGEKVEGEKVEGVQVEGVQGEQVEGEKESVVEHIAKKRGRKPKGGKIIEQNILNNTQKEDKPNIILHLKCSLKDIENTDYNNNIESFNFNLSKTELCYQIITNNNENSIMLENNNNSNSNNSAIITKDKHSDNDKEIWRKLKVLEHNLHVNNISDKKSACFWCSYEFDSNPIYIPKFFIKNSYSVYGCFCSPECATAHLMEENIDSSTKFERYYLLNNIYSKIYNYTKNIKPAPNPYYMLEKFYGNLSIQEYRALLKSERLFLIVDKPLTRVLPEIHEDNDEFIINNKIIPANYNAKKVVKSQTKNNIVSEHFGLGSVY